jgi:hypothetical protein
MKLKLNICVADKQGRLHNNSMEIGSKRLEKVEKF